MIKSMTGFGRSVITFEGKTITIEIKSLNSKQVDIYTRVPNAYKERDLDMRNILSKNLFRGKIELTVTVEITNGAKASVLNKPVINEYFQQLIDIGNAFGIEDKQDMLSVIMRLPETLVPQKEELEDAEWEVVLVGFNEAVKKVQDFRIQEGKALYNDVVCRVNKIVDLSGELKAFEKDRIAQVKERLEKALNEFVDTEKYDNNRLEQELIYYLEKLDITEEIVRLKNHCSFFNEVIESDEAVGKKLGFIAQEMGREINTIGAKANNSDFQRIVVLMKDELEKIKEQLMNVL